MGRGKELVRYVEDRPGHVVRHAVDSSRLRTRLGWCPKLSFDAAMRSSIRWYVDNEAWWRPLKSGEYKRYYDRAYRDLA